MTRYSSDELDGWEFKIVRANTQFFKKPENLRRVCEEEGRAGWQLLEKFDNCRVRFKRPLSARERDASLQGDPYRTEVGISQGALVGVIFASIAGLMLILLVFLTLIR